ncbi:DUF4221 family protein [Algoriphagus sp. CAU 1675]|uniref:DUF4221 family protein n=1 Tax=Algoriphagus sp. CAU 1675 TaxID=3032597 RepID=UPI0023DADEE1|nr:DUF4221 family protein [Algoriphagus sp. CAU 1675]MDF2156372.1 DUF4221 family protein [Algoriphagus sp. CAU 1675]
MKKLTLLLLLPLIFSCGGTSSEDDTNTGFLENFSYTIDTVMIDAGKDFIFLQSLNISSLSPDRNLLYIYNYKDVQLEVVDLNKFQLKEKIKLDKEGPLGVGNPNSLLIAENGEFFFSGFPGIHRFDPSLQQMTQFALRKQKFEALEEDEALDYDISVSQDGQWAFGAYGKDNMEESKKGLAVISLKDLSLRKIPVSIWETQKPYVRTLIEDGQMQMQTIEKVYVYPQDNRIILSSGNINEIYLVDLATDSVRTIKYTSQLTRNAKAVPEKTIVNTNEEMREMFQQANRDVEFRQFYFDEQSQKFFRFSRDVSKTIGDSVVYKTVMTLFDQDLQQIHEEEVPLDIFSLKFFKDGKLWSYVNVDDELGFAVMDLNF